MTPPRLIACHFNGREWYRMATVLAHTARQHCPEWDVIVEAITPKEMYSSLGVPGHVANTQKMAYWHAHVMAAADGDRLLLIDADTFITNPLDAIWDRAFDVAYTVKPRAGSYPFNGGVVFLRISDRVKAFVTAWRRRQEELLTAKTHRERWLRTYGGVGQAGLGYTIEDFRERVSVVGIPCREWNCEESGWPHFDPAVTKIVHVKGQLRLRILRRYVGDADVERLAKIWHGLEASATRGQKVSA